MCAARVTTLGAVRVRDRRARLMMHVTALGAVRVRDQHARLMTLGAMRASVTDALV